MILISIQEMRGPGANPLISAISSPCNKEGKELCTGLWVKREEGGRMALIPATRIFPIIFYKSSGLFVMREEGEAG